MRTILILKYNYKNMKWFYDNIENSTLENSNFRKVLYTAKNMQLVLMSLKAWEEIGMEVHPDNDQFFRFEAGQGKVIVDGNEYEVEDGSSVIIPCGAEHNVINTGDEDLKMYTIYATPHHKDQVIHTTKEEADIDEETGADEFDGKTTE